MQLDNHRLFATLQFLIKLNLFAIPLYIILFLDLTFPPFQSFVKDVALWWLNDMGLAPTASGYLISIPVQHGSWAAFISWDCTGWKSLLALFALVMASPATMKSRAKGLAIFLPVIFAANIVRIGFMFFIVKTYGLAYYSLAHAIIWSWGMIAAILVCWLIWMKYFRSENATPKNKYIPARRK